MVLVVRCFVEHLRLHRISIIAKCGIGNVDNNIRLRNINGSGVNTFSNQISESITN